MSSTKSYFELIDKVCLQIKYLYTLFLESRIEPIKGLSGFLLLKSIYIIIKMVTELALGEVPPVNKDISEIDLSKIKEPRKTFDDVCWLIVNIFKLAYITQDNQKRYKLLSLLNKVENIFIDLVHSTVFDDDIDYDCVDKELMKIKEELQEVIKV